MLCQSVISHSLRSHGLQLARLLCPWSFPGKNTGVGYYLLFQGIFQTQGSNLFLLCFLHWQVVSLPLSHLRSLINLAQRLKDNSVVQCMKQGTQSQCSGTNHRDGVERAVGWGEVSGWGDTCAPVTNSCQCMAKSITILQNNYPPIKIN